MGLFSKEKSVPGGALVLYTTRHGSTMRYAREICDQLDGLIKEPAYMKIKKAMEYDTIVLGCCVYEGKIRGMEYFADNKDELRRKRLVLFTCGLFDPALPEVRAALDAQIAEALGDLLPEVKVFHLRGAIRWRSLGVMEHIKMKKWMDEIRKKPEEARTLIETQLLEVEGGAIDFTDEADLSGILAAAGRPVGGWA